MAVDPNQLNSAVQQMAQQFGHMSQMLNEQVDPPAPPPTFRQKVKDFFSDIGDIYKHDFGVMKSLKDVRDFKDLEKIKELETPKFYAKLGKYIVSKKEGQDKIIPDGLKAEVLGMAVFLSPFIPGMLVPVVGVLAAIFVAKGAMRIIRPIAKALRVAAKAAKANRQAKQEAAAPSPALTNANPSTPRSGLNNNTNTASQPPQNQNMNAKSLNRGYVAAHSSNLQRIQPGMYLKPAFTKSSVRVAGRPGPTPGAGLQQPVSPPQSVQQKQPRNMARRSVNHI